MLLSEDRVTRLPETSVATHKATRCLIPDDNDWLAYETSRSMEENEFFGQLSDHQLLKKILFHTVGSSILISTVL